MTSIKPKQTWTTEDSLANRVSCYDADGMKMMWVTKVQFKEPATEGGGVGDGVDAVHRR